MCGALAAEQQRYILIFFRFHPGFIALEVKNPPRRRSLGHVMAFLFGKLADRKKTDAPSPDITEPPSPPPPKPKPPPPGTLLTHEDRLDLLVSDISSRAPPRLAEAILKAAPVLTPVCDYAARSPHPFDGRRSDAFLPHRPQVAVVLIKVLNVVGPVYIRLFSLIYAFLAALPYDLFQAAMGLGLCFFGGGYCASIAAAEAFYMTGWSTTRQQLQHIYEEAVAMSEAQTKERRGGVTCGGDASNLPVSLLLPLLGRREGRGRRRHRRCEPDPDLGAARAQGPRRLSPSLGATRSISAEPRLSPSCSRGARCVWLPVRCATRSGCPQRWAVSTSAGSRCRACCASSLQRQ